MEWCVSCLKAVHCITHPKNTNLKAFVDLRWAWWLVCFFKPLFNSLVGSLCSWVTGRFRRYRQHSDEPREGLFRVFLTSHPDTARGMYHHGCHSCFLSIPSSATSSSSVKKHVDILARRCNIDISRGSSSNLPADIVRPETLGSFKNRKDGHLLAIGDTSTHQVLSSAILTLSACRNQITRADNFVLQGSLDFLLPGCPCVHVSSFLSTFSFLSLFL